MSELPPDSSDLSRQSPQLLSDKWLEAESHGDPKLRALLQKQASVYDKGDSHDEQDVATMDSVTWAILERQRQLGINPLE